MSVMEATKAIETAPIPVETFKVFAHRRSANMYYVSLLKHVDGVIYDSTQLYVTHNRVKQKEWAMGMATFMNLPVEIEKDR